jgi:WD40-like Beta Propeller Repeat
MLMRAFAFGVVVAVVALCSSPAWGAFPGRDGELVVETGSGLELVSPATGAASPVCSDVLLCGHPAQPSFSPNGRAIAFVDTMSGRPVVVAADGSCLWCLLGVPLTDLIGSRPAFMPGGQRMTVARNGLWSVSLTGGGAHRLLRGSVDGAVWSSHGAAAVVRGAWIWVGRPGHGRLRRLRRGRSPSFSPDGRRLAIARHGYVWIVGVAGGPERRLVRGGSPAWSPSGRWIAYIGPRGAVDIVPAHGGRPHQVGSVHGAAIDWQPLPAMARNACTPPVGSTVLESTREAVVYSDSQPPVIGRIYGCLKALGHPRLLLDATTGCYCGPVRAIRLAGRFAALESESGKAPFVSEGDTLYDLGSGKSTDLASMSLEVQTPSGGGFEVTGNALDSLALDANGFTAWRETVRAPLGIAAISCPSESLCVAGDQAGNVLSSTNPTGGPPAWSTAAVSPNRSIRGVSCPTSSLCVAGDSAGDVLASTDPTGGATAWTKTTVAANTFIIAVSCPSASLCVAVGGPDGPGEEGTILTSSDPTGGASSWSSASIPSGGRITAVACPSVSLCVATTSTGEVLTSTDPTGGANAWTEAAIDPGGDLDAISCPSVFLCVAGGNDAADYSNGEILTTTSPAGGAGAWRKTTSDPGMTYNPVYLDALSCPSTSLCVTGDNFGNIVTSTDPTGGSRAWMKAPVDPIWTALITIACPSVSLCVGADGEGNLITSTDPAGGASTWTHSALSERLFAHDDDGTQAVDATPPGQDNSIDNVALDGNSSTLSWTHNGTERQLELR